MDKFLAWVHAMFQYTVTFEERDTTARRRKENDTKDVEDTDDSFPQLRNCASRPSSFEFVLNEG